MISAGKNVRDIKNPLQKVSIEQLYHRIKNPKNEIKQQIDMLRTLLTLDEKAYRRDKSKLPYVCCGNFHPPYRKTENFGSIENFIIDIDHINEKGFDINRLRDKLKTDPRVLLFFVSPSNDGLKVFFRLSEKCYDAGKYSLFYKVFAQEFSKQYRLEQVVDSRTSDVARACFISYDYDAYYNPDAEPVIIKKYLDFENLTEIKEIEKEFKEQEKENRKSDLKNTEKEKISPDILDEIKKKLNPNIRTKKEKIIHVPEELEAQVDKVKQYMQQNGITTKSVESIHYGKKFVFEIDDKRWAEINLFYGKKGFSVVITPKSGSNTELSEVCHKLMCEIFY